MKKIAVVEDDVDVLRLVEYNLSREGFAVVAQTTGGNAVEMFERENPDLIVLDIMLPDSNGIDICRRLRRHSLLAAKPVIFLTARDSERDRIEGLEAGANDYIVKPFFVRELVARIRGQLGQHAPARKTLSGGRIRLDRESRRAYCCDELIDFTATEFRLLEYLMSRPGVVFTRQQLIEGVWGHDRSVTERAVDVYVLRIRQKIECAGDDCIRSVRGFGYSFEPARP